jgi:hypothetical protein
MTSGRAAVCILLALTAVFAKAAAAVRQRHDAGGRRAIVMQAVAEAIGTGSLALSCDGSATRHPTEGPAGCLGDIPAGYCLRDMCDVVACPGPTGRAVTLERGRETP